MGEVFARGIDTAGNYHWCDTDSGHHVVAGQVFARSIDTTGNYHWCDTKSGYHIVAGQDNVYMPEVNLKDDETILYHRRNSPRICADLWARCLKCNEEMDDISRYYKYCPYCGRKIIEFR